MRGYQIIIADDHEIVRSGIKFILEKQDRFHINQEACSFCELIESLSHATFDLLILDLNLGDKNGIHALREISDAYPSLPILVLSMYPEETYALQSINAGASGYLNKTMVSEELTTAMSMILKNKTYLSETFMDTLPYGINFSKTDKSALETLSKREFQVYTMIVDGMTYKDMAEKLTLSPKTISTYRTRILEKLELKNINQLIHYSLQELQGKNKSL